MTGDPTRSGRYADNVRLAPRSDRREVLRLLVACMAVVFALLVVIATVDRAWLDCAGDLEPPERFAVRLPLLAIVLPATLAALTVVGVGLTFALRRHRWVVWVVALGFALAFTSGAAIALAVPNPFDDPGAQGCPQARSTASNGET
jgi:hypothetical protein